VVVQKTEQVVVTPGRTERREERVLVEPERIRHVGEQVLVKPATVVHEYVPPVVEEIGVGPLRVKKTVREGYYRDVQVPAVYETVRTEVRAPAHYEVRQVDVQVPPTYQTVTHDVLVPGHWEEVTVVPPPVVVPARPRSQLDIDLEFGKRH
jgi:hypothetical protein